MAGSYINPPPQVGSVVRAHLSLSPLENQALALRLSAWVFGCSLTPAWSPVFTELFTGWFLLCCAHFYFLFMYLYYFSALLLLLLYYILVFWVFRM